ncbi:MAG TPA: response regulator transcription factor [Puia sp.]|nr:response regulator transcription factor [Puia sp.]
MKRTLKKKPMGNDSVIRLAIIEDDETIRKSYMFLLGNEPDFEIVATCSSFEEAQNALNESVPDIILLDVQLPGVRGVDAIPLLKKIVPNVHVLVLTVYESEDMIFTALKNGASGYLTKNISAEKIIESVKEIMSGGGAMSSGIAKLVMQSFQKSTDSPLTKRETQILEGVANGKSRGKIAAELFIDLETVKTHIKNIYHKLDVNSKDEAIKVARDSKYI